ncbi:hypothetical protein OG705_29755 [Streptomyces sp. NBC_00838]|uniref:hypothetical protein n=1 Tax=Streptomyces sp. NBC_00838 TaxID=2903680 RepID=UPI003869D201|nr:hypothetical protein OG705_29755 [Streptomyces sp. NBC_00838]
METEYERKIRETAIRHFHHTDGIPVWLASNTCRPVARRQATLVRAGLDFVHPLCSSGIGVAMGC